MSEQAVATIGRCGCGWLDQARELQGGVRVARGEIDAGIFADGRGGALLRETGRRPLVVYFGSGLRYNCLVLKAGVRVVPAVLKTS